MANKKIRPVSYNSMTDTPILSELEAMFIMQTSRILKKIKIEILKIGPFRGNDPMAI